MQSVAKEGLHHVHVHAQEHLVDPGVLPQSGAGLELVDLSTPGRRDVDILANALRDRPELQVSRFSREILAAPESVRQRFQQFLQDSELSSHVRVVARRPGGDSSA